MKSKYLLFITFLFSSTLAFSQGIEFFHGTVEEVKAKAKETGKLVFVDAYTTWCGPCKRMASTIFPLEEVGSYYNANFINYKLDMEKGEGPAFAQKYSIRAYPTFVFIDGDGKLVFNKVGGSDAPGFLQMGSNAMDKFDRSPQFAAKYEAGDRNPELILNYIKALNDGGKSSLKVANEYLIAQPKGNSDIHYKIIYESAVSSDSKPFAALISNEKQISKVVGQDKFNKRRYQALTNSVNKSMEFETPELLAEALVTGKKTLDKDNYKIFELETELIKADANNDGKKYITLVNQITKDVNSQSYIDLEKIIKQLRTKYSNDIDGKAITGTVFSKWAEISEDPEVRLKYAIYLDSANDKENALKEAQKAKAAAEKKNLDTTKYDNTILRINSK